MSWSIRIEGVTPQEVIEKLTNLPIPSGQVNAAVAAIFAQRTVLLAQVNAAKDDGLSDRITGLVASAYGHINSNGQGNFGASLAFSYKPVEYKNQDGAVVDATAEVPSPAPVVPTVESDPDAGLVPAETTELTVTEVVEPTAEVTESTPIAPEPTAPTPAPEDEQSK